MKKFKIGGFAGMGLVSVVLSFLAYEITTSIRNPVPPLERSTYSKLNSREENVNEALEKLSGKNIEIISKLDHVNYDGGSDLEICLEEGTFYLKAESSSLPTSFSKFRRNNYLSSDKVKGVYEILKRRISTGELDSITLRGRLEGNVLKTYEVTIDGTDYNLLQHTKPVEE